MNISLIIPCYNEETNIQKGVLDKIGNFVKENDLFSEVVIVDDGDLVNWVRIWKHRSDERVSGLMVCSDLLFFWREDVAASFGS